jgi:SRSO17 transposase
MINSDQAKALCSPWGEEFEQMFGLVEGCFARSESREKAKDYVRGLMSDVKRKNGWQLAERLGMKSPLALQRLLNEATWDADYEVRYFHAWQRHMTLCLLAHGFLALCRHEQRKKNASAALRWSQSRRVPDAV